MNEIMFWKKTKKKSQLLLGGIISSSDNNGTHEVMDRYKMQRSILELI